MDFVTLLRENGIPVDDERVAGVDGVADVDADFVVIHHTAANRNAGPLPSLNTCKFGRGGTVPVRGPLCQLLIGRGGEVVAVTDGKANQAGRGSSLVAARCRADQPVGQPGPDDAGGNSISWGWEVENDGIGEPYTAACYQRIVAVTAVVCMSRGWNPATRVVGHREWTRRKIDPTYDMGKFRRDVADEIKRRTAPPTQEEDVLRFIKRGNDGKTVYVSDGITKRSLPRPVDKAEYEETWGVDGRVHAVDAGTFDRIIDITELDDHPND